MKGGTLDEAIDTFLTWRRTRGFAVNTIRRDEATLKGLQRAVERNIKVSSLNAEHVDAFFLLRSTLTPQTQNLDISTLRTFFAFLQTRGWHKRTDHLLSDYRPMKYEPPARRRIPVGEFPSLLASAEHPRDRILLASGLYLFLRSSEVRLLRVSDVSLSTDEISVRVPKTKDRDVMPISSELAGEMRAWLTYYAEQAGGLDQEWFLVPSIRLREWTRGERGQLLAPLEQSLVPTSPVAAPERIVKKYLTKIGWSTTVQEGVHTLRRSGARALYDELAASDGHSNALETVSAMLHHKVMATTQIYLGLTESRRKRDRLIAGRPMFPSLADTTVTPIGTRHDRAHG